jgi:hypothetical protein
MHQLSVVEAMSRDTAKVQRGGGADTLTTRAAMEAVSRDTAKTPAPPRRRTAVTRTKPLST